MGTQNSATGRGGSGRECHFPRVPSRPLELALKTWGQPE